MYQELADNYDEDWLYQFKTAFCYAMTYLTENREVFVFDFSSKELNH